MSNWGILRGFSRGRAKKRAALAAAITGIALAATTAIAVLELTSSRAEGVVPTAGTSSTMTVDNSDLAISYAGAWRDVQSPGGTSKWMRILTGAGSISFSFTGTEASWRGTRGPGAGIVDVYLDSAKVATVDTYSESGYLGVLYSVSGLTDAAHTLEIRSLGHRNPSSTGTEISIDTMTAGSGGQIAKAFGVYERPLDVDSLGEVAVSVRSTLSTSERDELSAISSQPIATWFGDWNADIETEVRQRVASADARGAVASLVMYNIPNRDCGHYSANTPTSAEAYRAWVRGFVAGLGSSRHIVIIEPDALSLTWCLSADQTLERYELIGYAADQLALQGSWSYIDAGHNQWLTAEETAHRLKLAGVARATGFSLNVSNFKANSPLIAHGLRVSPLIGGKHFVIDTSRNGQPLTSGEWCNPLGMGLGPQPTTVTGSPLADAYLWIKAPGQSDGPCNGGPAPGGWFHSYALGLVRNAGH